MTNSNYLMIPFESFRVYPYGKPQNVLTTLKASIKDEAFGSKLIKDQDETDSLSFDTDMPDTGNIRI